MDPLEGDATIFTMPDPETGIQSDQVEPVETTQEPPEEEARPTPHNAEQRMRRKLRFFFMNPIEKFQAKGRLPWKLGLQVVKIILVTVQLVLFGYDSYAYQQQHRDTNVALDHIFLKGWDSVREIASYPPASGPYAVYTKDDYFAHLDNVIRRFTNVTVSAIASFGYDTPDGSLGSLSVCKTCYSKGTVWPYNETLIFDNKLVTTCLDIEKIYPANDVEWWTFSSKKYMKERNFTMDFERLSTSEVNFTLKTVYLKSLHNYDFPECYMYNISVHYGNEAHDGQLLISLRARSTKLHCNMSIHNNDTSTLEYGFRQFINVAVIFVCVASFVLCGRSLLRGQSLKRRTHEFFLFRDRKGLSYQDGLEFVDFWYVMIMANDFLIVVGSVVKVQLELRNIDGAQYNLCSTLLGTGNLLVWAGVLRYLGFFRKYNILILTMKRATPNILRFLLCAMLLYMGFCFCGWVVLGPHHIKFRSLSSTSECLFALMNGDDMFATFAIMGENTGIIWWFARIYLYVFLILFIYCVISLFLSVIMDSYETIREYHETDIQPSNLWKFIAAPDSEGDEVPVAADLVMAQGVVVDGGQGEENKGFVWNGLWRRFFTPREGYAEIG